MATSTVTSKYAIACACAGIASFFLWSSMRESASRRRHQRQKRHWWKPTLDEVNEILRIQRKLQRVLGSKVALFQCPHLTKENGSSYHYDAPLVPGTSDEMASFIDHTLLSPTATPDSIRALCQQAMTHHFYAVCVNGSNLAYCKDEFSSSLIDPRVTHPKIAAVIGFPLGAMSTECKVFETKHAIEHGATEIDMVLNIGLLRSGNYNAVLNDVQAVSSTCIDSNVTLKVILECGLLTQEEIVQACLVCVTASASFVKTSTGFLAGGAQESHVRLMRTVVGDSAQIKASGGIGDWRKAQRMIRAGANRIGASRGMSIIIKEESKPGHAKAAY